MVATFNYKWKVNRIKNLFGTIEEKKMGKLNTIVMVLIATLMCCMQMAAADPIAGSGGESSLLAPPEEVRPIVVRASFKFHDINEINDEMETFDFSGVLILKWRDPRQAFDPVAEGANERVFQGSYQFNELAAGCIHRWSSSTKLTCTRRAESCFAYSQTEPRL